MDEREERGERNGGASVVLACECRATIGSVQRMDSGLGYSLEDYDMYSRTTECCIRPAKIKTPRQSRPTSPAAWSESARIYTQVKPRYQYCLSVSTSLSCRLLCL